MRCSVCARAYAYSCRVVSLPLAALQEARAIKVVHGGCGGRPGTHAQLLVLQCRCCDGRSATPRCWQHHSCEARGGGGGVRVRRGESSARSGTLSPMPSLVAELRIPFPILLENPHVIDPWQVLIGVVTAGPTGHPLNSSYTTRDTREYKNELGNTVFNFARMVRIAAAGRSRGHTGAAHAPRCLTGSSCSLRRTRRWSRASGFGSRTAAARSGGASRRRRP